MLALPVVIIFALCAVLAAATGSPIPPVGYLTIGVFCLVVIGGQIATDRGTSSWMRARDRQANLTAWFEAQLGEPVRVYAMATSASVNLPSGIDQAELSGSHGLLNAPLMAGARALTNRISRVFHVKGAKRSSARLLPVDDGTVYLVLGLRGLTMWQVDPMRFNESAPVYLRGFAHGSQLASVTTRTWTSALTGRFLVRLRFVDGSRYDYQAYDTTRAAAFEHNVGAVKLS